MRLQVPETRSTFHPLAQWKRFPSPRGVHQQSDCSSFFIHRCVHRQLRSLLNLRNYSQGEIVTIAALVAHLVSVAVTGEDRAVRKITECARNRWRRRIVDYRENCTRCEGATSKISKGKLRATVNGHPVGDHLIGGGCRLRQMQ